MSEASVQAIILAAIAGLPATLMAWAVLRSVKSSRREGRRAGAERRTKLDALQSTTAQIHSLTDGNLTRVQGSLDSALAKISGMEALINQLVTSKQEVKDALQTTIEKGGL